MCLLCINKQLNEQMLKPFKALNTLILRRVVVFHILLFATMTQELRFYQCLINDTLS